MNHQPIGPIIIVVMLMIFTFSPNIGMWLSRCLTKSGKQTVIAGIGAFASVGFAAMIYLMSKNPHINPWEIIILMVIFVSMATMGIISLAFISTIPEQMEREAEDEQV